MTNPNVLIAIFDDDPDLVKTYKDLMPYFGITVDKSALSLSESKKLIPKLSSTEVVAALIDGSIGGQVIIDMLAEIVPHIKRIGFSGEDTMQNTHLNLYKPMHPQALADAIKSVSKSK